MSYTVIVNRSLIYDILISFNLIMYNQFSFNITKIKYTIALRMIWPFMERLFLPKYRNNHSKLYFYPSVTKKGGGVSPDVASVYLRQ